MRVNEPITNRESVLAEDAVLVSGTDTGGEDQIRQPRLRRDQRLLCQ